MKCFTVCFFLLVVLQLSGAEDNGLTQLLEAIERGYNARRCLVETNNCDDIGGPTVAECTDPLDKGKFSCSCKSTATYSSSKNKCVAKPQQNTDRDLVQLLEAIERDDARRCLGETKNCEDIGGPTVAECTDPLDRGMFFCNCKSTATYNHDLKQCVPKSQQNTGNLLRGLLDLLAKKNMDADEE